MSVATKPPDTPGARRPCPRMSRGREPVNVPDRLGDPYSDRHSVRVASQVVQTPNADSVAMVDATTELNAPTFCAGQRTQPLPQEPDRRRVDRERRRGISGFSFLEGCFAQPAQLYESESLLVPPGKPLTITGVVEQEIPSKHACGPVAA
jgi:hypothetical protein